MRTRTTITGLFLFALLGCGGNDQRPTEAIPASFTTDILPNGTKLFTFELEPQGPPDGAGPRMQRGGPGPGPDGRPPRRGPSAAASHKQLASLLAENHYCREGYVTLQQYGLYGGYTIRGECRDGADDSDRSRFPAMAPKKSP